MAAPFGGAPGFGSDALLTGVQFAGSLGAYFFVDRGTFRQACVQSPAVYELLPPPHFPYAAPAPELTLWLTTPLPGGGEGAAALASGAAAQPGTPARQCASEHPRARPRSVRRVAVPSATHPSMHRPGPEAAAAEAAAGVRTLGPEEAPLASWHEAHEYKFALDQLGGVLQGVLEGNSVSIGGQAVAMPFNPDVRGCRGAGPWGMSWGRGLGRGVLLVGVRAWTALIARLQLVWMAGVRRAAAHMAVAMGEGLE